MRFQVPQFVDIEDKIIGPLTMKQFAFYIIATMILGILYVMVDIGLLILLALPVVGTAVLFAHAKFYGQSFGTILINAMNFFSVSRLYLWRRVEKDKILKVSGTEYGQAENNAPTLSIDLMNQALNTEGNVVETDAADPLLEESDISTNNTKEAPTSQDTNKEL
jgi:hypothetical protein